MAIICLFGTFINVRYRKLLSYLVFIFLLFIGAFRSFDVGIDNTIYSRNFNVASMDPATWSAYTEFEPGFAFFLAAFKTYISSDYLHFMAIVFLIYFLCINGFIRKISPNVLLSFFFLIVFTYYTKSFNMIRQSLALGFACLAIIMLEKHRNYVIYTLIIFLISFFIHRTILIFLFVPLIAYTHISNYLFKNKFILYIIIIFSYFFVFSPGFVLELLKKFLIHVPIIGDRYINYLTVYMELSSTAEITISKYSSLLNVIFGLYAVYLTPKNLYSNLYYRLYILSIPLANILGAVTALFIRVSFNFQFFQIIYFVLLWYYIESSKRRLEYRVLVIIYGSMIFVNALLKNFGSVVPYQLQ